ncbi:hypothetical protein ACF073_05870 [Streptomyces sp. NPDC015171]
MTTNAYDGPDGIPHWQRMPVPPPFMFGCGACVQLMTRLARKIRVDEVCF